MYESTFHFRERPFVAAPLTDRYFRAAGIEQTLATLARGIERAEGPGLLIGPAGTGKSLVCHLLAEHFRDEFHVALLTSARLGSRRALLQNILYELGLPYRDLEEGELRLALIDHLDPSEDCPHGLLLLVDEAHTLPLRLLEEIRMITNLVRDGMPRVRLVLAGGPELEERFASPRLQSLQQRITARCYLKPLNREETRDYVRWQVTEAGSNPDELFTEGALKEIYTATGGVPRLVNQLCDHGLIMAAVGGKRQLDEAGIAEAWADLQQLPAPLYGTTATFDTAVVEFGQLYDEPVAAAHVHAAAPAAIAAPAEALDPTAAFDEIEELLHQTERLTVSPNSEYEEEFEEGWIQPSAGGTEVELVFHDAHNPFGQDFEEEEVIIDRYASLESNARRAYPRVSSEEGREIAAAISGTAIQTGSLQAVIDASPAETAQHEEFEDLHDPASDPVLPDSGTRIDIEPRPAARTAAAIVNAARREHEERETTLRVASTDDRDAIVIDDPRQESDDEAVRPLGIVRRQEYRQLFAKLRKG